MLCSQPHDIAPLLRQFMAVDGNIDVRRYSGSPGGPDNFGPNIAPYFPLKLLLHHTIIIVIINC